MAGNKNYENYKKPIKIWAIVQAAASALALIAIVLLFFVPNFKIDLSDKENVQTTLPKIENRADDILGDLDNVKDLDDLEKLLESANTVNFSFYDEMYATVKPAEIEEGSSGGYSSAAGMMSKVFLIYQIAAAICLVAAFALMAYTAIKSGMGVVQLDTFAITTYDELKRRERKKRGGLFTAPRLFITGIMLEVICIVMLKSVGSMMNTNVVTSYFALMGGLSGASAVTIIFLILALGGFAASKFLKGRLATQIIKDEYAAAEEE